MKKYKKLVAKSSVVLLLSLLVNSFAVSPVHTEAAVNSSKPNVILVMLDDLGQVPFDALVNSGLAPNLAALKARGMTFNNSFVSNARGCPDRTTMLTGQYYHNGGMPNGKCGVSLFDDSSTLPVWLKTGGYTTALIGRYTDGLGYTDINKDGVVNNADITYTPPGWDWWQPMIFPYTAGYNAPITTWYENANTCGYYLMTNSVVKSFNCSSPANYQSDVLGNEAVKYIQTQANNQNPFFLAVTPTVTHVEVWPDYTTIDGYTDGWLWKTRAPERYVGTTDSFSLPISPAFNESSSTLGTKPPWVQSKASLTPTDVTNVTTQYRSVLGSLRGIDDMLGSITTSLSATGQLDNTVIILTTDNGWLYGEHRLTAKLAVYEESIRVPLIIAGPGVANGSSNALVLNNDLAPTIADLGDVATDGKEDGTSLVPLLSNSNLPWRNRVLLESWPPAGENSGPFAVPTLNAIRTQNDKFVQYGVAQNFAQELYILNSDPYELFNEATNVNWGNRKSELVGDLQTLRNCGKVLGSQVSCQQLEFSI